MESYRKKLPKLPRKLLGQGNSDQKVKHYLKKIFLNIWAFVLAISPYNIKLITYRKTLICYIFSSFMWLFLRATALKNPRNGQVESNLCPNDENVKKIKCKKFLWVFKDVLKKQSLNHFLLMNLEISFGNTCTFTSNFNAEVRIKYSWISDFMKPNFFEADFKYFQGDIKKY